MCPPLKYMSLPGNMYMSTTLVVCTPDTWSYTVMDEILEALNEQLSMKQDLNRGLLLQLSFIKKSS